MNQITLWLMKWQKLKGNSLNESDHAYAGYVEIKVHDELLR